MTYQKKNTSRDVCNTSTKSIIGLAKEKDLQDFLKQLLKDVSDYLSNAVGSMYVALKMYCIKVIYS